MKDPKITVRLSEDELRALKSKTAQQGTTIQAIMKWYIEGYLRAVKVKFRD